MVAETTDPAQCNIHRPPEGLLCSVDLHRGTMRFSDHLRVLRRLLLTRGEAGLSTF